MTIVYDDDALRDAMEELSAFGSLGREGGLSAERPVLIDRFLEDATEVDVDAIRDHTGDVVIGAVMEHVEEAGVHSGDSACAIPPYSLSDDAIAVIEAHTRNIADALDVRGLVNVQYAVKQGQVFVIEANPRASRTVPFVAKATGVPLVKVAARVMLGATLAELRAEGLLRDPIGSDGHVAVKEAVLPFNRFPDADSLLGPGDALDRRGDGHRPDLRPRLRQVPARGRRRACRAAGRCSSPSPTATSRWRCAPLARSSTPGSRSSPRRVPPTTSRPTACRWRRGWPRSGRSTPAPSTPSSSSTRARSTSSSTALGAAAPGPTAPTSAGAAAVNGVPVPHDRRRRPRRRRGHRRPRRPRAPGPDAAGVPPRAVDGG